MVQVAQMLINFYRYREHMVIFEFTVYMHYYPVCDLRGKYCAIFMHPPKCKLFMYSMTGQKVIIIIIKQYIYFNIRI